MGLHVLRSASMTLRGVEEESFKELLHYCDHRAPKPTRKLVRQHMNSTEEQLRQTLKDLLKAAGKISFTTGNRMNNYHVVGIPTVLETLVTTTHDVGFFRIRTLCTVLQTVGTPTCLLQTSGRKKEWRKVSSASRRISRKRKRMLGITSR